MRDAPGDRDRPSGFEPDLWAKAQGLFTREQLHRLLAAEGTQQVSAFVELYDPDPRPLTELLVDGEEDSILDKVSDDLALQRKRHGEASLTEHQAVFADVYRVPLLFENGGFLYFFETTERFAETVAGFERIDWPEAAEGLRRLLQLFPGGMPHADSSARMEFCEDRYDEFEALEGDFGDCDEVFPRLATYVRRHPEGFPAPRN